jgi:hypothetical protein
MYPHNSADIERRIEEAKYARMEFMRKNRGFFAYCYGLLGLLCAFAIAVLLVGGENRDQQHASTTHANWPHGEGHK